MIQNIIGAISIWAIPVFLVVIPVYGAVKGVKVYESFVEGAKGGFQMAIRIIPYLVAILVAVGMLRGAGAIDMLARWLDPVLRRVGFPVEILPLAIMRPLSGSGSLGNSDGTGQGPWAGFVYWPTGRFRLWQHGNTFYVLAVYFGAVGIKKTRHAVFRDW